MGSSAIAAGRNPVRFASWAPLLRLLVRALALLCLLAAEAANAVDRAAVLNDAQLDSVTAGSASVDLELSASAEGATAITSTKGLITTGRATVLRIAIDPSAPEAPRLLGSSAAEFVFGVGTADASGTKKVGCSAIATPVGDVTLLTQSSSVTGTSATCSCSAFAISLVK